MWRYEGGGWIPGVPTRDMDDDEMDALAKRHPGLKESPYYKHLARNLPATPTPESVPVAHSDEKEGHG